MTFDDYLKKDLKKVAIPTFKRGHYSDLTVFFDEIIKPYLFDKDVLKAWHTMLMDYVNSPKFKTYIIRQYGNYKNNKDPDRDKSLRRGFLTKSGNYQYFCVDNSFSRYIGLMAYDKFVPLLNEFEDALISKKNFPSGTFVTKPEKVKQVYKKLGTTSNDFKLSHIFDANCDYRFSGKTIKKISEISAIHFPRGDYGDWTKASSGLCSRTIIEDDPAIIDILKSIFLRLVHPFNYFWSPKKEFQESTIYYYKKDIGEDPILTNLIHDYYLSILPKEYKQYMDAINTTTDKKIRDKAMALPTTIMDLTLLAVSKSSKAPKTGKAATSTSSSSSSSLRKSATKVTVPVVDRAYKIIKDAMDNNILTEDGVKFLCKHNFSGKFTIANKILTDTPSLANPTQYFLDPSKIVTFKGKQYAISKLINNVLLVDYLEESLQVKVAEYAHFVIHNAIISSHMPLSEFNKLLNKASSKTILGCNYPVLVDRIPSTKNDKYNQTYTVEYNHKIYYMSNDWYDRCREKLMAYDLSNSYSCGDMIKNTIIKLIDNNKMTPKLLSMILDKDECYKVTSQYKPFMMKESDVIGKPVLEKVYKGKTVTYNGVKYIFWNQFRNKDIHKARMWCIKNYPKK